MFYSVSLAFKVFRGTISIQFAVLLRHITPMQHILVAKIQNVHVTRTRRTSIHLLERVPHAHFRFQKVNPEEGFLYVHSYFNGAFIFST